MLETPKNKAINSPDASLEAYLDLPSPRLLGIFAAWRLRDYSFGIVVVYAVLFIYVFRGGGWIVSSAGTPLYTDFSTAWVAGVQALHGNVAALYDPVKFAQIQTELLGPQDFLYPNWPYPPILSLIMAPFGLLPYLWAFVAWNLVTLAACLLVVYLI